MTNKAFAVLHIWSLVLLAYSAADMPQWSLPFVAVLALSNMRLAVRCLLKWNP